MFFFLVQIKLGDIKSLLNMKRVVKCISDSLLLLFYIEKVIKECQPWLQDINYSTLDLFSLLLQIFLLKRRSGWSEEENN